MPLKPTGDRNLGRDTSEQERQILNNLAAFTGFARSKLGGADLAAEAVQRSLLKALEAEDQLADQDKVIPWFYTILRRTIIDLYRSRGAERTAMAKYGMEVRASEPPLALELSEVCACLHGLPPGLRPQYAELIERLDLGGESPALVAADLGISTNNLKVRRHRARQQLGKHLRRTCGACAVHGCLDCSCGRGGAGGESGGHSDES